LATEQDRRVKVASFGELDEIGCVNLFYASPVSPHTLVRLVVGWFDPIKVRETCWSHCLDKQRGEPPYGIAGNLLYVLVIRRFIEPQACQLRNAVSKKVGVSRCELHNCEFRNNQREILRGDS
jgi:hypothetical protein